MADKKLNIIIEAQDKASASLKSISGNVNDLEGNLKTLVSLRAFEIIGRAALEAGKVIFGFAKEAVFGAAKLQQMEVALITVSKNMGISTEKINEYKDALAETNTYGSQATNTILKFVQSGLAGKIEFPKFIKVIKDYAATIGVTSADAIDDFTRSINTLLPTLIQKYGVTRNLIYIYDDFAKTVGKTRAELTEEEKKLALLNEVYAQGASVAGVYNDTYVTLGKNLLSLQSYAITLKEAFGDFFVPALAEVTNRLVVMAKTAQEWFKDNQATVEAWGTVLAEEVVKVINGIIKFVNFLIANKEIVTAVFLEIGVALGVLGAVFLYHSFAIIATIVAITAAITLAIKAWNTDFMGFKTWVTSVFMPWFNKAFEKLESDFAIFVSDFETGWEDAGRIWSNFKSNIDSGIWTIINAYLKMEDKFNKVLFTLKSGWQDVKDFISPIVNSLAASLERISKAFDKIKSSAQSAINKVKEVFTIKMPKFQFQHGGVVPGSFNQATPAILHGGERVIPRMGTDVNGGGGASNTTININIAGDVNSEDMLDRIVVAVKQTLGRDSELSQLGASY